ncbi:MAG TPA: hypothetical protein VFX44_00015 [Solirubrobacterales bacterium]|nr:hypothetical protein [Solirubrobacterales bacterium]
MKYLKILGLAAIAAAALMAFAGSASATTLTCTEPAGTKVTCPKGTLIESSSEGHAVLDNEALGNVECNSKVAGKTSNAGSSTETVSGNIETLTFENCTSAVVVVLAKGTLEIHTEYTKEADGHETQKTASTNNGTLTSTGAEVTVEKFGFHCIFKTNGTDLGTVTGSSNKGGATATLDISARIPRTGGRSGIFCGESSPWTGSYIVNKPDWMDVD